MLGRETVVRYKHRRAEMMGEHRGKASADCAVKSIPSTMKMQHGRLTMVIFQIGRDMRLRQILFPGV